MRAPRSRRQSTRRGRARPPPWAPPARSCRCLRERVEDPYTAESGGGAAVAHRRGLPGLALAAVERPAEPVGLRTADRVHRAPEVGDRRLVGRVAHLPRDPPRLDAEEALSGELE